MSASSSGALSIESENTADQDSSSTQHHIEKQPSLFKLRALSSSSSHNPGAGRCVAGHLPQLTDDQLSATLQYFMDCLVRTDAMTAAYKDETALGELLEEKEKDLQLAARIGQSLLEKNKALQEQIDALENQLAEAHEDESQLRYELQLKADLLKSLNADTQSEANSATPTRPRNIQRELARSAVKEGFEAKVLALEEENEELRAETSRLRECAEQLEEREQSLVADAISQLSESKRRIANLHEASLANHSTTALQQSEITQLMAELVDEQLKAKQFSLESDELRSQLVVAEQTQSELSSELVDMQERYAEVVSMLAEVKTELQRVKKHNVELQSVYDSMYESLQSELESSVDARKPKSVSPPLKTELTPAEADTALRTGTTQEHIARAMQAVRQAATAVTSAGDVKDQSTVAVDSFGIPCGSSPVMLRRSGSRDSLCSFVPAIDTVASNAVCDKLGVPGVPGSHDLQISLKRLSLRRQAEMEYRSSRLSAISRKVAGCFNPTTLQEEPVSTAAPVLKIDSSTVRPQVLERWRHLARPSLTAALTPACSSPSLALKSNLPVSPRPISDLDPDLPDISTLAPPHLLEHTTVVTTAGKTTTVLTYVQSSAPAHSVYFPTGQTAELQSSVHDESLFRCVERTGAQTHTFSTGYALASSLGEANWFNPVSLLTGAADPANHAMRISPMSAWIAQQETQREQLEAELASLPQTAKSSTASSVTSAKQHGASLSSSTLQLPGDTGMTQSIGESSSKGLLDTASITSDHSAHGSLKEGKATKIITRLALQKTPVTSTTTAASDSFV